MNKESKIEAIKQACTRANPAVGTGREPTALEIEACFIQFEEHGEHGRAVNDIRKLFKENRPIQLTDVLLAIKENGQLTGGEYQMLIDRLWNLRTDDLTQQSDQTIDFLYELLNSRSPSYS